MSVDIVHIRVKVLCKRSIVNHGNFNKTKGENYLNIVIVPEIRAVARSVIGRYTPEQLYSSKRDAIQNEIYEETMRKVDGHHVQLNASKYGIKSYGISFVCDCHPEGIKRL